MKLVQPSYAMTLYHVRRYSELAVNCPQRRLETIPYIPWTAPLAPRRRCLPPLPAASGQYIKQTNPAGLAAYIEQYRQHINGSEFTSSDLAEFLLSQGWQVRNPEVAASNKLRQLWWKDQVCEVRHERTVLGRGKKIVWKFNTGRDELNESHEKRNIP